MKKSVVCCGDRSAEAGLLGALWLAARKMLRLLKQALGQSHALFPCRVFQFGLLRSAPKVEVGFHAELFHWLDDVDDLSADALGGFIEPIFATRLVGKEHSKKDCGGSSVDQMELTEANPVFFPE